MKLLPCPFCGGEVSMTRMSRKDRVLCYACGVDFDFHISHGEEETAKRWNMRKRPMPVSTPPDPNSIIGRIKLHREKYNSSLWDAKNAVEAGWKPRTTKSKGGITKGD